MTFDLDDTICAIASAPGGALRGIVRISGPRTVSIVEQLFAGDCGQPLADFTSPLTLAGILRLPRLLGEVPARLYLWPTERSYTRQPAAELHLAGSPPLLDAALEVLCRAGARLARPGEFTLRAFLAGRLDLTQAEAVLGVIEAASGEQLKTALTQLAGGLAEPLAALRERLLNLLAHLEAGLDFVDENIEFISSAELDTELAAAADDVATIVQRMAARGEARELPRVVLIGEPNAGKSSLFNALVERSAAIVSPAAGTTRDYLTCPMSVAGQQFLLVDTAGAIDADEQSLVDEAQKATASQRSEANLLVFCLDLSQIPTETNLAALRAAMSKGCLIARTKCDQPQAWDLDAAERWFSTSSLTHSGIKELRQGIAARLAQRHADTVVASTSTRCRESLELAAAALQRARSSHAEELVAAELRTALDAIGQVVGAVYTDDLLDRVFSRFCIGK